MPNHGFHRTSFESGVGIFGVGRETFSVGALGGAVIIVAVITHMLLDAQKKRLKQSADYADYADSFLG
jgi:hypothetical protein